MTRSLKATIYNSYMTVTGHMLWNIKDVQRILKCDIKHHPMVDLRLHSFSESTFFIPWYSFFSHSESPGFLLLKLPHSFSNVLVLLDRGLHPGNEAVGLTESINAVSRHNSLRQVTLQTGRKEEIKWSPEERPSGALPSGSALHHKIYTTQLMLEQTACTRARHIIQ